MVCVCVLFGGGPLGAIKAAAGRAQLLCLVLPSANKVYSKPHMMQFVLQCVEALLGHSKCAAAQLYIAG